MAPEAKKHKPAPPTNGPREVDRWGPGNFNQDIAARITAVTVVPGGVRITLQVGTKSVASGMVGDLKDGRGIIGSFAIEKVDGSLAYAVVHEMTPDDLKNATAIINPKEKTKPKNKPKHAARAHDETFQLATIVLADLTNGVGAQFIKGFEHSVLEGTELAQIREGGRYLDTVAHHSDSLPLYQLRDNYDQLVAIRDEVRHAVREPGAFERLRPKLQRMLTLHYRTLDLATRLLAESKGETGV